jgi:uncharacterized membrane protein
MLAKKLSLLTFSIFALVLVMGLGSAATIFTDDFEDGDLTGWTITNTPDPLPLLGTEWTNTGTFAEAKPGADTEEGMTTLERTIDVSDFENIIVKYDRQLKGFEVEDEFSFSWSIDGTNFNVLEETVNSTPDDGDFVSKTFNLPTLADDNANFQLKVECTTTAQTDEFCRLDNVVVEATAIIPDPEPLTCEDPEGSLRVDIDDIQVIDGFGDDDEWFVFDEIEIDLDIDNKNDDEKIKDVTVEWGLWSTETDEWVIEMDDVDEFDISKDDTETLTVDFKLNKKKLDVDIEDLEEGDYTLYVMAYGEEQEDPEFDVCTIETANIELIIEDDFVVLNDFEFTETVSCGTDFQITADVWNIGQDDQDEVSVRIYNTQLGLDRKIEIGDIDAFDNDKLDVLIKIPEDAEEKAYLIEFKVYDEDNDIYVNDYDDEEAAFEILVNVEGSCSDTPLDDATALVSAILESGGQAGEALVIRATLTNTGETALFSLNAAGYAEWANSVEIDPTTYTLAKGESKDILFTFDVKEDVQGDKLFNIEVLSDNQLVAEQPVSVTIGSEGTKEVSELFGENWYLWLIGLLNVILVIIIIIVAIKVAKR